MSGDDVLTMPAARRIEVFTGVGRRRRWTAEAKAGIVAESYATSVGETADRHALCKNQLFAWRRDARRAAAGGVAFTPVVLDDAADDGRPDAGVIEVELGAGRVRIGRGADVGMAAAVIGVLRGGR
ncbi:MAG: transposase [Caulobacteraceae bacterium]